MIQSVHRGTFDASISAPGFVLSDGRGSFDDAELIPYSHCNVIPTVVMPQKWPSRVVDQMRWWGGRGAGRVGCRRPMRSRLESVGPKEGSMLWSPRRAVASASSLECFFLLLPSSSSDSSGEFRATFLCLESQSLSGDRRPIMFVRRPKLESVGRSALNLLLFQLNSVT